MNAPKSTETTQKAGRSPRNGETRSQQIVEIAAAQFASRGYAATSLQDIAEVVGVKKSSLYAHFASKQELLIKILDAYITDMLEMMVQTYAQTLTPTEKLRQVVHFLYEAIGRYRNHVIVFFEELNYLVEPEFEAIRIKRDGFERLFTQVVIDGIEAGELEDVDPQLLTFHAVGMVTWAYKWFNPNGRLSIDEVAEFAFNLLMNGARSRD